MQYFPKTSELQDFFTKISAISERWAVVGAFIGIGVGERVISAVLKLDTIDEEAGLLAENCACGGGAFRDTH